MKSRLRVTCSDAPLNLRQARFEPKYNHIKLLKMQNKDEDAQRLLTATLALDTREMGNRVAADFNYPRDLEGFAVFAERSILDLSDLEDVVDSVRRGKVITGWLMGGALSWRGGWWAIGFVLFAFGFGQMLARRYQFFFPCSGCGGPPLQMKSVYEQGMLDCELCLIDVSTASKLERKDLNRHHRRVGRWRSVNHLLKVVSTFLVPPLGFLREHSPARSFFSLCLLTGLGFGVWLSVLGGSTFSVRINAGLLDRITSVFSARAMETS